MTVPVVSQALEETASARGTVVQAATEAVPLVSGDGNAVVTDALVEAGSTVASGQVLTEINGRPVIALQGRFAYYRNLSPGATGPDVSQLQSALAAAGYAVRVDGDFGPSTERAVRALYRAAGYKVPDEVMAESPTNDAADSSAERPLPDLPATQAPVTPVAPVRQIVVPASEITAISTLPATAVTVPAVGTSLSGDPVAVTLSSGDLIAHVNVAASLLVRLTDETPITISRDDGQEVAATALTLPAVGDQSEVMVNVRPAAGFSPDWLGADVLAVFVLQSVQGESLVVPTAAVVPGGNGPPTVLRLEDDGSFRSVPVTELGSLGGRTAIAPVEPEALAVGSLVRMD
ncbi:peptidoglycan-binding domain-containing protein [Cellulomonas sp. NPDC055163]